MQAQTAIVCPECGGSKVYSNGKRYLVNGLDVQRYKCANSICGHRFSDNGLNIIINNTATNQICAIEAKNLAKAQTLEMVCAGDINLI